MNIKESIHSLIDAMGLLSQLDDEEYLQNNDISGEEAKEFKEQITEEIKQYKGQFKEYMNQLSNRRQVLTTTIAGWEAEAERITNLINSEKKKLNGIESRMEYLMKTFQEEKLYTNIYKLSFRKSESIEIVNEELLPKEYVKEKITTSPDKTSIKEAIKKGIEVPGATLKTNQNLQIK